MGSKKSTGTRPRVLVSRQADSIQRVSRNADSVRARLKNGEQLVILSTGDDVVELTDKELRGAGQSWVLRIVGRSNVRIRLTTPLPRTAQIVATDRAFVEATGCVTVHAYMHANVHAFDECVVRARNFAQVSACDFTQVDAIDEVTVFAFDQARVRAGGQVRVSAIDQTSVHLLETAHASVRRGVRVTGPSRSNLQVERVKTVV